MRERTEIEEARKRLLQSFAKPSHLRGVQLAKDVTEGRVDQLIISAQIDAMNWMLGARSMLGDRLAALEEDGGQESHATSNG